jgi:hypothetical protein
MPFDYLNFARLTRRDPHARFVAQCARYAPLSTTANYLTVITWRKKSAQCGRYRGGAEALSEHFQHQRRRRYSDIEISKGYTRKMSDWVD